MKGLFRIAMILSCCAAASACTSSETPSDDHAHAEGEEHAHAEGEEHAHAEGEEHAEGHDDHAEGEGHHAEGHDDHAEGAEPTSQPTEAAGSGATAEAGSAHAHEAGGMDHVLGEGDYDPASVVRQPGAVLGDISRCPVSGEVFEVTADATFVEHEGQNVYFCCPGCIRRFQRDPERWLATQPG